MKTSDGKVILQNCLKRGWVRIGDVVYTPAQAQALNITPSNRKSRTKHHKTAWTDDTRNLANKEKQADAFMRLVQQQLGMDIWPEFHFLLSPHPDYRFDYAIPDFKIAIEQEGGVWAKGNSGHSSGTGIMRDMDKSSLAAVHGWTLIRRTPKQLLSMTTISLTEKAIQTKKNCL